MMLNVAVRQGNPLYVAAVLINNSGKVINHKTVEYKSGNKGKYWSLLKACEIGVELLTNQDIHETITFGLSSAVMLKWIENGKAVEPYRYAFEKFYNKCLDLNYDIEFLNIPKGYTNRAFQYANSEYIAVELYDNVKHINNNVNINVLNAINDKNVFLTTNLSSSFKVKDTDVRYTKATDLFSN